jgi:hypothetical protein
MKARDYRDYNKAMSDDFLVFVRSHPDAFDILLFKPDMSSLEKVAVDQDVVGALESEERSLEYLDPVAVKAVLIPDEFPFGSVDAGGEPDGNMDQPSVLLIADPDIPKQSVVQYREFINDNDVRVVSLYVLRSEIIGEAPGACEKHFCVPFQVFDYEFIEPPSNEQPVDEAEKVVEMPTLAASDFIVHGTNDTHGKSQWQIRAEAGTYDTPAHDSEACTDLRSHVVPSGKLDAGAAYFWRVRYRGAEGDAEGEEGIWSEWSEETRFVTMEMEVVE